MAFNFEEVVKQLAQRADAQGLEPHGRMIFIEGSLGTVMGMQILAGKEQVRYTPATVVLEDIDGNRIHKVLLAHPKEESSAITEEDIKAARKMYEASPGAEVFYKTREKTLEVMTKPEYWRGYSAYLPKS